MTGLLPALASDLRTPAPALAALAHTYPTGRIAALLAAHPAAPPVNVDAFLDVCTALSAPHLPTPRAEAIVARSTLSTLSTYVTLPGAHPVAVARFAAACTTPDGHLDPLVAPVLMAHPNAALPVRRAATDAVLRDELADDLDKRRALAVAAGEHPALLTDLPVTRAWMAPELAVIAAAIAAGTSPRAVVIDSARRRAERTNDAPGWVGAIRATADPDLALHALRVCPAPGVRPAILNTPQLTGTPAWYAAHARSALGFLPDAEHPPRTAARALEQIAKHATSWRQLATAASPLDESGHAGPDAASWDARTAAAVWETTQALTALDLATAHPEIPAALLATTIAVHPSTDPLDRRAVAHWLRSRTSAASTRSGAARLAAVAGAADALATDPSTILDVPLKALSAVHGTIAVASLEVLLTAALGPHLPVLDDPQVARALVALEPSFAGSTRELLRTATTLAR